jgi:hypothetical protein
MPDPFEPIGLGHRSYGKAAWSQRQGCTFVTANHNGNPGAGSPHHVPLWVKIFGTGGIVGLIAALVSLFTYLHVADEWPFGRGSAPVTPAGRATAAAQPTATLARFTATTGPSCSAAGATFDETGAWTPLPGTVPGNCGALEHETADNGQGANWIFNPGLNATCTFSISIPASSAVTAYRVTYQEWETRPGKHSSQYKIGTDHSADQVDRLGGTIEITSGKTATGMIDLQLYDDNADGTWEVAGPVTAVCSRPLQSVPRGRLGHELRVPERLRLTATLAPRCRSIVPAIAKKRQT